MQKDAFFDTIDTIYSSTFDNFETRNHQTENTTPLDLNDVFEHSFEIEILQNQLENFPDAIIILNQSGQIIYKNPSSDNLSDGISITDNKLAFHNKSLQDKFKKTVTTMIQKQDDDDLKLISLTHLSEKRPYHLWLKKICHKNTRPVTSSPRILIVIKDPEQDYSYLMNILNQIYALSKREAELSILLCEGINLPDAADKMSLTYDTVRTMLKRIFKKVGCNNQKELLRIILTIPK